MGVQNATFLHLVLIEEHIRDAICDGELAPRLGTHQVPVDDLDFEEDVVRLLEEVLVVLVLRAELGGKIAELVELLGGAAHLRPVQFRDDAGDELRVELHLENLDVFRLQKSEIPGNPCHLIEFVVYVE